MGKPGPETRLVAAMRKAGKEKYGERLVTIKYHGSPYSEAGVSDLLNCLDGVFIAVEAKAGTGHKVTMKQQAFLDRVEAAGGIAAVCWSVEQFMAVLAAAEARIG
jgi:hypothetical protein